MNLPNKITLTRIFIIPLFMIFVIPFPDWMLNADILVSIRPVIEDLNDFIMKYGNYIGAAIFITAASTDGVDGYLARKTSQVTQLGIFLDPIADKLLVTTALIALVVRDELSGWAAMVIISRELIISGFRIVAAGEGLTLAASAWGKVKTILQIVAIVASLVKNFPLSLFTSFPFDSYFMFIAVLVTIYSGIDYFKKNINILRKV